jgi:hypothetical protein
MTRKVDWSKVERLIDSMSGIDHDTAEYVLSDMQRNTEWYNRKGWTNEQVIARVVNMTEQRERRVSHETGYY